MSKLKLITVYVTPDGANHKEPPLIEYDTYIKRQSTHCDKCNELLLLDYDGPFAHCACGSMEWYK